MLYLHLIYSPPEEYCIQNDDLHCVTVINIYFPMKQPRSQGFVGLADLRELNLVLKQIDIYTYKLKTFECF